MPSAAPGIPSAYGAAAAVAAHWLFNQRMRGVNPAGGPARRNVAPRPNRPAPNVFWFVIARPFWTRLVRAECIHVAIRRAGAAAFRQEVKGRNGGRAPAAHR